jgi:hypothetical protein
MNQQRVGFTPQEAKLLGERAIRIANDNAPGSLLELNELYTRCASFGLFGKDDHFWRHPVSEQLEHMSKYDEQAGITRSNDAKQEITMALLTEISVKSRSVHPLATVWKECGETVRDCIEKVRATVNHQDTNLEILKATVSEAPAKETPLLPSSSTQ